MNEAQRFPEDFDGMAIGAPGLNGTGSNMRRIRNAVVQSGPGAIALEKLPLLADAVYKKCDGVDGLKGGLIDDPRKCEFDPARDLPKCAADSGGPNCFTGAQMEALKNIYDRVRNSSGWKRDCAGELIGAHAEGGEPKRTRPLCPYPEVARYRRSGSIEAAENFACAAPSGSPRLEARPEERESRR